MLLGSSQAGTALVWREEVSKAGLLTGGREGCSQAGSGACTRGCTWSVRTLHQELSDVPCRPPAVSKHKN